MRGTVRRFLTKARHELVVAGSVFKLVMVITWRKARENHGPVASVLYYPFYGLIFCLVLLIVWGFASDEMTHNHADLDWIDQLWIDERRSD